MASLPNLVDTKPLRSQYSSPLFNDFKIFPELPFELRSMIFEACAFPRNVMMHGQPTITLPRTPQTRPLITPCIPVLFHVNREARKVATKIYQRFTRFGKDPIYFNPVLDTIFCFTSAACTDSPEAFLNPTTLYDIPKPLRSQVRRVVIKINFGYITGQPANRPFGGTYSKRMKRLYKFLKEECAALEDIMIVLAVPKYHLYGSLPCAKQTSDGVHTRGKWIMVEYLKDEHPEWDGPSIYRGRISFA
ncbi:hypothetical protein IFR05_014174 [Cadophora sp. M221]|nr:hypothetical protein IFR05_014174 [Cadophora sp. M221]